MKNSKQLIGNFLRKKRESLDPEELGIGLISKRRTPGLRREEVAEAADISVDWYTRIEQGRGNTPSENTLRSLGKVLKLNQEEVTHLINLSQNIEYKKFIPVKLPLELEELVHAMDTPAYIINERYDVLVCNKKVFEYFEFSNTGHPLEKNLLYQMFVSTEMRKIFINWKQEARELLEGFRLKFDLWAHDSSFNDLQNELIDRSKEFADWWGQHSIQLQNTGEKYLNHRNKGEIKIPYCILAPVGYEEFNLILYGKEKT